AYRVGECLQVVGGRLGGLVGQAHDLPPAGRGEPLGMLGAQVVTVRLRVRRERTEHGGRVGVNVREREDGRLTAGGARTAADGAHGGTVSAKRFGRHYRGSLKERVATISQVSSLSSCAPAVSVISPAGPGGTRHGAGMPSV